MGDLAEEFEEYAAWADDQTPLYGWRGRSRLCRGSLAAPGGCRSRVAEYYPTRGSDAAPADPGGVRIWKTSDVFVATTRTVLQNQP